MQTLRHIKHTTAGLSLAYTAMAVAFGLLFLNFTADDAYITFRYAKNLAAFGQWSWNPAGHLLQDVEAYTNPLFAALAIPVHMLGWPPTLPFKLLGLVILACIFRSTLTGLTPIRQAVAAAFVCTNFAVFPHAFSGLETDAFLLVALWALNADERDLGTAPFSALVLVAPLIRPEGALISVYILCMQVRQRQVHRWTWLALAAGAAYMAWRLNRYGQWLPNTYYAKMHEGDFFLENLKTERYVVALGMLSWWAIYKTGRNMWLPTALLLSFVVNNLRSDMQMNYLHRFSYHTIVPLAFCAARAQLQQIGTPLSFKPRAERGKLAALAGLFVLALMTQSIYQTFLMLGAYPESLLRQKELAHALRQAATPATVIAVEDAGTLPYYTGLTTIDYVGLASREITGYLHGQARPALPAPDLILLYTGAADSCEPITRFTGIHALMQSFVKGGGYACIRGIQVGPTLFFNALVRQGAPNADALSHAVRRRAFDTPRASTMSKWETVTEALRFDALKEDFKD